MAQDREGDMPMYERRAFALQKALDAGEFDQRPAEGTQATLERAGKFLAFLETGKTEVE